MSLSLAQAQWLIHFMRSLPGQPRTEPEPGEYEQAMHAQRAQAHAVGALAPWEEQPYYDDEFEPQ